MDLITTEFLRVAMARTGDKTIDVVYYYLPTNDVVLKRSMSEDAGTSLHSLDPAFWTIIINGGPATATMIEGISTKRFAFKVDHTTRTLHIKMEL